MFIRINLQEYYNDQISINILLSFLLNAPELEERRCVHKSYTQPSQIKVPKQGHGQQQANLNIYKLKPQISSETVIC